MPMSWTPENDRLLLLKLVETHGISINAEAIVKAWRMSPTLNELLSTLTFF
jgi:hypothetical protein